MSVCVGGGVLLTRAAGRPHSEPEAQPPRQHSPSSFCLLFWGSARRWVARAWRVQAGAGVGHVSSCEPSGSSVLAAPTGSPSALRMRPSPADHPPEGPPPSPQLPQGSCPNPDPAGPCRPLGMGGCTRQTLRTFQNCLLVSATAGFPRRAASCGIWRAAGLRLPVRGFPSCSLRQGRDSPRRVPHGLERAPNVQLGDP